jgi:hypothetical protein
MMGVPENHDVHPLHTLFLSITLIRNQALGTCFSPVHPRLAVQKVFDLLGLERPQKSNQQIHKSVLEKPPIQTVTHVFGIDKVSMGEEDLIPVELKQMIVREDLSV